ncbi:MAG: ABC transporter substrate-binding protein [Spirochaetales bacterium]|nr:ABC transporter substrate-binding protein [Spirochaetales bacterium]
MALSLTMAVLGLALTSCQSAVQNKTIVVGSKMDTEGGLLGQMIRLVLIQHGYHVVDRLQLGGTAIVRKALLEGQIDIYPEYTGNGAYFFHQANQSVWKNASQAWQRVHDLDLAQNKLVWLPAAPADNTWAIAVSDQLAQKAHLATLSDLAAYVNKGGYFKLAGSDEFVNSPAALPSFEAAYGFHLEPQQVLTLSGGNTATTEKACAEGTNGVNAAMAYGTDGQLAAFHLVVLTDDKNVQPVYQPAPLVRQAVLLKYPDLSADLAPVFALLDLRTLQTLNAKIVVEGQDSGTVARQWLTEKGFLR